MELRSECRRYRRIGPPIRDGIQAMSVLIKNGRIVTAVDDYHADLFIRRRDGHPDRPGSRHRRGYRGRRIGEGSSFRGGSTPIPTSRCRSAAPCPRTTSRPAPAPRPTAERRASSTSRSSRRARPPSMRSTPGTPRRPAGPPIDYAFHMIITDLPASRVPEMRRLADEGVTSYKMFMGLSGGDARPTTRPSSGRCARPARTAPWCACTRRTGSSSTSWCASRWSGGS